ncbi:hypothetical protein COS75_00400 [Candidatus Pacearchaeota archaeon CG06_land_8_20_14_3_00_35_12]|nr:MAG: hypothetical protein COS75_00400 [Candidatus Pacearchaeota archaeon CG06_land_8_20_14_3_00_35_12]
MTKEKQKLEVLVQEAGTQDMIGVEFPVNKLLVNGKEIDKATHIQALEPIKGKEGNLIFYYKKQVLDVYSPITYNQNDTMPMPVRCLPVRERKGVGPQFDHQVLVYIPEKDKKHSFFHDNDSGYKPEEWYMDEMKVAGSKLLIKLRNNYEPGKSKTIAEGIGSLIKIPKKSLELTANEAKALIDEIGPSLGCDFTYDPVFPETRKDVCAVRRLAEDGSDYGYDTIYLVWKSKKGKLDHEELIDSSSSKDYIHVDKVEETKDEIIVKVRSGGSFSGRAWERELTKSKSELE